jgi:hypothetical protein
VDPEHDSFGMSRKDNPSVIEITRCNLQLIVL